MEIQNEVEILEFSPEEVSLGVEHAAKKYGIRLDGRLVRVLANRILMEMREYDQLFEVVRNSVLERENVFPWSDDGPTWYSALGKMFSLRRVAQQKSHARKGLKMKRKVSPHFKIPRVMEEPNQQLAWRF